MKHVNRKNWNVNISSFCFTTVQRNKIIHRYVLGFCPMVLLVSCSFVSCAEHSCIVKKSHIFLAKDSISKVKWINWGVDVHSAPTVY